MIDDRLEGYWRDEHATPGKPRLVHGDPSQFAADLQRARLRAQELIELCATDRRIVQPGQQWWHAVVLGDWD